jgi:hypothetical protein
MLCPSALAYLRRIVRILSRDKRYTCGLGNISNTADEQGIAREDCLVVAIFKEVANTVLRVAWRMQCFDFDVVADCEGLAMTWCL